MPNVFEIELTVFFFVSLVVLALKIFALVTALMFTPEHYRAADKLTKPAWVAILGIGVAAQILWVDIRNLVNLALTIAALVYLVDVRPALKGLRQRR